MRSLTHVLGARDQTEQRRLEDLRLRERHLDALVDRFQDVADRDRRLGRERRGELLRLRHQVRGRDDAVDETEAVRFLRRDLVAGQQQLQRAPAADDPREALRAGVAGNRCRD